MQKLLKARNIIIVGLLLFAATAYYFFYAKQPKSIWQLDTVKPFHQWYQINWYQQAVGWAKISLQKDVKHYQLIEQDFIEGRVQGELLKFSFKRTLNFSNKKPYQLLSGSVSIVEPNLIIDKQFVNGNKLVVEGSRNTNQYNHQLPKVDYRLTDYFKFRRFIEQQPKLGSELINKEFNSQDFGLHYSRYRVSQVPDSEHSYYRVRHSYQNTPSTKDPLQSKITLHSATKSGVSFRINRPTGIEWLASEGKVSLNPGMQKDLYLESGVAVDKKLGNPRKITNLSLTVTGAGLDWFDTHPDIKKDGQTISLNQGSSYSATHSELNSYKDLKQTESDTSRESYHHKSYLLAQSIVDKNDNDLSKVRKLLSWVNSNLSYKTLPANFTLNEILEQKIGDCTEHALLLTNLLANVGIASREVSGLVYLGDDKKTFGGHVWVEVLLDGNWQAVDPTWNLMEVTATHIPLSLGQEDYLQRLNDKNKIKFNLEKVSYNK